MLYVMASIFVEKKLYMIIAMVEPAIPKKVFISASEIPVASWAVSGEPWDMAEKERIIPITVPINPISVATEASVERTTKFFDSIGSSRDVASSNSF